jgi:ATP-dependent helicase/nuclease subunit A
VPPAAPKHAIAEATQVETLPPWALSPAPREPALSIPLAPSRLEAYAPDDEGEPLPDIDANAHAREPMTFAPGAATEDNRFLRGNLTHALLEHLPSIAQSDWQTAAQGFVAARGPELTETARASIVKETLAILTDPRFAPLFGLHSRAEVPIVARLPNPKPGGAAIKLIGQIDRLIDLGDRVLIVDYKTNRPPPKRLEDVADAYLFQLAAYRRALAEIYPEHSVQAALLWTETPRIMQVPDELLDTYAGRLWDLDVAHLDASEGRS